MSHYQEEEESKMPSSQQNEIFALDTTAAENGVTPVEKEPSPANDDASPADTTEHNSASRHRGYDYRGYPEPGDNDHLPMYPGVNRNRNPNGNLENMFKANFRDMIDMFSEGKIEPAEAIAQELLLWGNLPTLYRTFSHIVLAYGVEDGLFHAHKAIEEAEWALQRHGDLGIGGNVLARAREALQFVQKGHSEVNSMANGEEDAEDEEVDEAADNEDEPSNAAGAGDAGV